MLVSPLYCTHLPRASILGSSPLQGLRHYERFRLAENARGLLISSKSPLIYSWIVLTKSI